MEQISQNQNEKFRIENKKLDIKNKVLIFICSNYNQISEMSSSVQEFKNNFTIKIIQNNELSPYFNEYKNIFEESINIFIDTFIKDLTKRIENKNLYKILNLFIDNYDFVSSISKTEEEFMINFERKKNLDNKLIKNFEMSKTYYNEILNDNIKKFKNHLKHKIENLFFKKYSEAINISKDEIEFKYKLKELLEQKEDIKILLQKEEYKRLYEQIISENLFKIKIDIHEKEDIRKNQEINKINEFIDINYNEIYKISNNKSEFVNNMKIKASNMFRNISYFNIYLNRRAKDFEIEKLLKRKKLKRQMNIKNY